MRDASRFVSCGLHSLPVIRLLKEPPARRGFLELPKFEELLAQFPPNLKPYITFLYFAVDAPAKPS